MARAPAAASVRRVFVSSQLAAAIEAAETRLLLDIVAAMQRRRPEAVAWSVPLAGGAACCAGPGSPLDKIVGLGFAGAPDPAALAEIEARYHQRGLPAVAEVSSHADPEVFATLAERGYRLTAHEDVLGRATAPSAAPAARRADGIDVRPVRTDGESEAWFGALLDGFAAADAQGVPSHDAFPRDVVAASMRDMVAIDGLTRFAAWIDGELAGGGSLRVSGPVAHLCGAATLPRYRRRGVQSALVAARLAAAAAAGCEVAVTVTQPGSKSQQNMTRQGFALCYVRAILTLPPAAATR